jgi:hypothetical protein
MKPHAPSTLFRAARRRIQQTGPLAALAALVACHGLHGEQPADYQGNVPLRVTNGNGPNGESGSDEPVICMFALMPPGKRLNEDLAKLDEGWLRDVIRPGGSVEFKVKPGRYHVYGFQCKGSRNMWDPYRATAIAFGETVTAIAGPTEIVVRSGPAGGTVVAHPGYTVASIATLPFVSSQAGGGGGGGEAAGGEEPAEEPAEAASPDSSSSTKDTAAAPSGPSCLQHGAVCDDQNTCCAGMTCASQTKFSDGSRGNGYCQ